MKIWRIWFKKELRNLKYKMMIEALASKTTQTIEEYRLSEGACDIDLIPLSGRFSGKGVIIVLKLH